MKIYINKNVEACENNGVLEKHFQGFVKTAQKENVVIILRPVNPITKQLLAQKYPTKSSNIKNKSSDWGIQAGFILALDEFSFLNKVGLTKNETQLEKLSIICKKFSIKLDKNDKNKKSIKSLNLAEDNSRDILKITNEHFYFLLQNQEKFGIIDLEFFLKDNIFVRCSQPKNKKNEIVIYLEKAEKYNFYNVYYIFALDEENKVKCLNNKSLKQIITTEKDNLIYFPIIIFCKKFFEEKKPIIPDYDLFAVCWKIDEGIKKHQPRIPTNSFASLKLNNCITTKERYFNKIFKKPTSRAKGKDFEQDEEGAGNVLDKTKEFLDKLNKNLGYEKGLKDELRPIHHTFELVNPYATHFNENFYTFFLPNDQLLTDFTFPDDIKLDKQSISYFAVHEPFNHSIHLWQKFLEPFLIYIQTKGYYVPNNCFVKQTEFLGFANSSNPWVRKIREEQNKERKSNELTLLVNVEAINSLENDKGNYKKINAHLFLN